MTDLLLFAFDWTWTPGFRGLLTVVISVIILCGSVYLILATNSGTRLGFLLALTGFFGWMFVMGIIWSLYGIGWKGDAPTWSVVDVVQSEPDSGEIDSRIEVARELPLPDELPDPVELRNESEELTALFPVDQRDPSLGDLVTADPDLWDELNEQAAPWTVLESSNKYTGETQAAVAEYLGPDGEAMFTSAADYKVIESFLTGGKEGRTDDSILGRVQWKVKSVFDQNPPTFYAVVQLQQVVPQTTKPGQAPPTPIADPDQPIVTVVLERVGTGELRQRAIATTIVSGIITAICCNVLHRRDKLSAANRAAVAGAS